MRRNLMLIVMAVVLAAIFAGCGGSGTPVNPPDGFDKLTARLVGSDGSALAGVSVRVEGQNTGVTTDANGYFTLLAGAFPNGADGNNEISFGRGGFIIGSTELVPSTDPDIEIKFDPTVPGGGEGNCSVAGHVYENSAVETFAPVPLDNVEVTLFSVELGGVYQTHTDADGAYSFENVESGSWQMTAFLDGYHPEMAMLVLNDDADVTYDFGLTPEGGIPAGEGIYVRGVLTDSKSGEPIAGALVSCMADTGYMGICEDGVYDDVVAFESGPVPGVGGGSTDPGVRSSSMAMPWRYDPQYQETTTESDGSFEFPNPVVGYSVWLNYSAENYLSGSYYESIDGRSEDLELALTLDPVVPTDISGVVRDENGDPVEGAYVEFIFSMGGIGPMPMDLAVPVGMDLEELAANGTATRDNTGTPPPPAAPGAVADGDAGWDDWASAPAAGEGSAQSGSGADNMLMQRFRFEHQGRNGSDVNMDGYYTATTGADGTFAFTDVPAGMYTVFASAYKHLSTYIEFEAQEDAEQNVVEIELPNIPVGTVEGVILDEDGLPLDDVLVTCTQPFVDPFTYTDATGHYIIENVPAGDWIISGYKQGFLTASKDTAIGEDLVSTVNLELTHYEAPVRDTIPVYGLVVNGSDNTGVSGASMVFTPTEPELGSYYRHVYSNSAGEWATDLIPSVFNFDTAPSTEYNLLIQAEGFEDLYTRIYIDAEWPEMDYWLWPIGSMNSGGWAPGGPGGGPVPEPDPNGGGGGTEPGPDILPPGEPTPL